MTAQQNARQVLRPKLWLFVLVLGGTGLFIAGFVSSYQASGWDVYTIGFAALSALGCVGCLELGRSRIVLSRDALESRSALSRRRYTVADVESITWESGCGVSVKLSKGGWAKLPDLGYDSQGLANTLRAWLKRGRAIPE